MSMKWLKYSALVVLCLFLFLSVLPLSGCGISTAKEEQEETQIELFKTIADSLKTVFKALKLDRVAIEEQKAEIKTLKDEIEKIKKESNEKQALIKKLAQRLEEVAPEPPEISPGFTSDPNLIDIRDEVKVLGIPNDLTPYKKFFDVNGVWGEPRGGYHFAYNDAPRDNTRRENIQLTTFAWLVITGEELWVPGIGGIKDSLGGESLLVIINAWEVPTEFLMAYILHGCWITGRMFNMSDLTDNQTYTDPKYGDHTLESMVTLRNHYLYHLTTVDESGFNFVGHTGKYLQADSVTYVLVIRWYDGSFRLVDQGQYVKEK